MQLGLQWKETLFTFTWRQGIIQFHFC